MKPKQRNWTDEDDQYLKEHWFEPLNKIGEKFNVTGTAIRYRLEKKLGIERPKGKIANMRLRASIYRDRNKDKVPEDWMELPSTRQDAKKINSSFFWDGQPCDRAGHMSRRKTSSGGCWDCDYGDHKDKLLKDPEFRVKRNKDSRDYFKKNKKEYLRKQRERKNSDEFREWARKHDAKRRQNIDFRLAKSLRDRLYHAIKRGLKFQSASKLVGCSIDELKEHLSKQFDDVMSWENYGKWHIDHIRPCDSFDLTDKDQQKVCFHYFNLQPLLGTENQSKKDSYTPLEEVVWVERMQALGYEGELFLKYEEGNSY